MPKTPLSTIHITPTQLQENMATVDRILLSWKYIQASFASFFYSFLLDASLHFRVLLSSCSLQSLPLEEWRKICN